MKKVNFKKNFTKLIIHSTNPLIILHLTPSPVNFVYYLNSDGRDKINKQCAYIPWKITFHR